MLQKSMPARRSSAEVPPDGLPERDEKQKAEQVQDSLKKQENLKGLPNKNLWRVVSRDVFCRVSASVGP